jgi:hypothetical protein
MELVIPNVGLDLGVLSPTFFAMFVLIAVVTTLATTLSCKPWWLRVAQVCPNSLGNAWVAVPF